MGLNSEILFLKNYRAVILVRVSASSFRSFAPSLPRPLTLSKVVFLKSLARSPLVDIRKIRGDEDFDWTSAKRWVHNARAKKASSSQVVIK